MEDVIDTVDEQPRLPEGFEPLISPDGVPTTTPYHSRHDHASRQVSDKFSQALSGLAA